MPGDGAKGYVSNNNVMSRGQGTEIRSPASPALRGCTNRVVESRIDFRREAWSDSAFSAR